MQDSREARREDRDDAAPVRVHTCISHEMAVV